ncbi:hypothetical protein SBOR_8942 [Sclerotinia borealis F-4128]|uniref:Uncharacterized protein n=1 Tax=Sclerotinia borealis (strain F-4128) TaxID=1432307 RepID=W9C7X2_SCLBF|nr:hypothetical protein SBOR_8942 [Sclerotinia borealis F-4128]
MEIGVKAIVRKYPILGPLVMEMMKEEAAKGDLSLKYVLALPRKYHEFISGVLQKRRELTYGSSSPRHMSREQRNEANIKAYELYKQDMERRKVRSVIRAASRNMRDAGKQTEKGKMSK